MLVNVYNICGYDDVYCVEWHIVVSMFSVYIFNDKWNVIQMLRVVCCMCVESTGFE